MELRASGAERWVPCTGSPSLEAPFPDTTHIVAEEGNRAHALSAECFKTGNDAVAYVGELVDIDFAEGVQMYLDTVRAVAPHGVAGLYVEYTLGADFIIKGMTPTPDAWYYDPITNTLYLWDLKFGWRIVSAIDNWQLVVYLLAILSYLDSKGIHPKNIEASIVQPRAPYFEGRVRTWRPTLADLTVKYQTLVTAAGKVLTDPKCNTGSWCHDCRALAACPAAQEAALAAVSASTRAVHHDPSGADLAAELTLLTAAKEALTNRLTALEAVALDGLEKGKMVIPGWSTERAVGRRRWKGNDKALKGVAAMTGVNLFEEKPVTPAEAKRRGMKDFDLAIYAETPEGKLNLVKRDVEAGAAKVFGTTGE
jgi:hypothetical protein